MLPLHEIKGVPRVLLTLTKDERVIDLVIYPDGSHGIVRDGKHIGVWEPGEDLDCIRTLARMVEESASTAKVPRTLYVLRVRANAESSLN